MEVGINILPANHNDHDRRLNLVRLRVKIMKQNTAVSVHAFVTEDFLQKDLTRLKLGTSIFAIK